MKACMAEMVGTFVLVIGGVGSAVLAGSHIGFMGVALAFGLSLLAMVYTIGPVSGCHINPAVTFGLFLSGKFPASRIPGYWISQVIGTIIASAVLYQTPYAVTALAYSRVAIERIRSGFAVRAFHASQQASTMPV